MCFYTNSILPAFRNVGSLPWNDTLRAIKSTQWIIRHKQVKYIFFINNCSVVDSTLVLLSGVNKNVVGEGYGESLLEIKPLDVVGKIV